MSTFERRTATPKPTKAALLERIAQLETLLARAERDRDGFAEGVMQYTNTPERADESDPLYRLRIAAWDTLYRHRLV